MMFIFGNLLPGGLYKWNMTCTSLGSNPVSRSYDQLNTTTRPVKPLTVWQAAVVSYATDSFQLDVGQLPHVSRSFRLWWGGGGSIFTAIIPNLTKFTAIISANLTKLTAIAYMNASNAKRCPNLDPGFFTKPRQGGGAVEAGVTFVKREQYTELADRHISLQVESS